MATLRATDGRRVDPLPPAFQRYLDALVAIIERDHLADEEIAEREAAEAKARKVNA